MDYKIIWTERASSDIDAIVRYIARRDPEAAARIGFGIFDRANLLLSHPEAGPVVGELRSGGWRKLVYRRWKIVYRRWKIVYAVRRNDIVIGRIWPAALGDVDLSTPL